MIAEWFDMIEGVSAWWWVALGIALGAIEMLTMSFFLIWPGLAAIVIAALIGLFPSMPGEIRVAGFAAIAVALTFLGRSYLRKYGDGGGAETKINSRAGQLVGRRGKVLSWSGGEGAIEIDGIRWRASWEGDQVSEEGKSVEVVSADGMLLKVRNHHVG